MKNILRKFLKQKLHLAHVNGRWQALSNKGRAFASIIFGFPLSALWYVVSLALYASWQIDPEAGTNAGKHLARLLFTMASPEFWSMVTLSMWVLISIGWCYQWIRNPVMFDEDDLIK